jgi:hypothetical protein
LHKTANNIIIIIIIIKHVNENNLKTSKSGSHYSATYIHGMLWSGGSAALCFKSFIILNNNQQLSYSVDTGQCSATYNRQAAEQAAATIPVSTVGLHPSS